MRLGHGRDRGPGPGHGCRVPGEGCLIPTGIDAIDRHATTGCIALGELQRNVANAPPQPGRRVEGQVRLSLRIAINREAGHRAVGGIRFDGRRICVSHGGQCRFGWCGAHRHQRRRTPLARREGHQARGIVGYAQREVIAVHHATIEKGAQREMDAIGGEAAAHRDRVERRGTRRVGDARLGPATRHLAERERRGIAGESGQAQVQPISGLADPFRDLEAQVRPGGPRLHSQGRVQAIVLLSP